jgi:hypothetical protein
MRTILDLDALRVQTFETAPPVALSVAEQAARTPLCSAIDLCPTRPC